MYQARAKAIARGRLKPGAEGIRQTLGMMAQLARAGSADPLVRSAAVNLIRNAAVRPGDPEGEAAALFRFVSDHVRYTGDVEGVETLQSPSLTLKSGVGDCDDKATLLAALLKSVSNPLCLSFRAIGTNPNTPEQFRHVYLVGRLNGGRISLDATRENTLMGWEFPRPTVAMEVAV